MKNAIVFGATGQLGCYSALALKENGYNVYAIGRRSSDGGFFETKGINFIGGITVENKEAFNRLPDIKFDVVVNNMSESFNSVIFESRSKPLVTMVEEIRTYCMEKWATNRTGFQNLADDFLLPNIRKKIDKTSSYTKS